ncbi:NAD(P)-dependent oxidoreductase [Microbacterium sp. NPDC019599]|uniref:NAD(P)-dependent oxidoreductase n=1 Tax=Microbacterium sp. NPDC019599 TaxID=3154690 RepID=UPI0033D71E5B
MAVLGFLGLGRMGSAMARRLVEAGHEVHVWNRSPADVERLVEAGAVAAGSPGEALATGLSFSMLADDDAAEGVLSDESVGDARGIHVCMASISPAEADRLEARFASAGVGYVAAPVLGRPSVAAEGRLNILAAGEEAFVAEATPFLETLGVRVWRFGDRPRQANVVKVAVNFNIIHAIQALGESIAMTERHGIDAGDFHELLVSTLFDGVVYRGYGREIVDEAYVPPGFLMALGFKDLRLAEAVAAEAGLTLPTAAALHRVYELALADEELRRFDWGGAAEVTRRDLYPPDRKETP